MLLTSCPTPQMQSGTRSLFPVLWLTALLAGPSFAQCKARRCLFLLIFILANLTRLSEACSGGAVNTLTPSSPCYAISFCLDFTSKQLATIDCTSFPAGTTMVVLSNNSITSLSTAAFYSTISTVGSITKLYVPSSNAVPT